MFNCDDAMREISGEYTSMPLKTRAGKTVHLRNLLMLGDEALKTARGVLRSFEGAQDADVLDVMPKMRELLLLLADDKRALEREVADWPIGMYMRVIQAWQEATDMGEASDSAS